MATNPTMTTRMIDQVDAQRAFTLESFYHDRPLAHAVLFAHRHGNETPPFHREMILDFHNDTLRNLCEIAFRGSAKSTIAEEGLTLKACYREIGHALIVGASFDKAAERLHAIRRQFEKNELLIELFGNLVGKPWGDDKIELQTGVTIQAMGRGQAIRGTKNEDIRPDFILADDIEDLESLQKIEGREKIQIWFFTELLPAGDDPILRVRVLANDMHPECIPNKLKAANSGFTVKVYPWEYIDPHTGLRCATWPDRYSLGVIDGKKRQFYALGRAAEYQREYMCHSENPEQKPFKQDMLRIEPITRTWQACYSMIDPARTVNKGSATTGGAVWSWIGNRLIVWRIWARPLLPDEIVGKLFEEYAEFHPVWQGFEEDGLNQWALQPIRQEMTKRGVSLPLKPVKAPKGKLEFIRGLQPFFMAREVVFAENPGEVWAQFTAFPSGNIDAPNALAYALRLRPGAPVYDDFSAANIVADMAMVDGRPAYLVLNASRGMIAAALCQSIDGALRVYADWVREGEPAAVVANLLAEVNLEAARAVKLVGPRLHFDQYNNVGLAQAVRKAGAELRMGAPESNGRAEIRRLMQKQLRGMPALLISTEARMSLNGFAGGYARALLKGGQLADVADDGPYRLLIEGIESFAGLLSRGDADDGETVRNMRQGRDGKLYQSALREQR